MPPPTLFNSEPYGCFLYLNIELGLHSYPCKLDFRLFWEYSGEDPRFFYWERAKTLGLQEQWSMPPLI